MKIKNIKDVGIIIKIVNPMRFFFSHSGICVTKFSKLSIKINLKIVLIYNITEPFFSSFLETEVKGFIARSVEIGSCSELL